MTASTGRYQKRINGDRHKSFLAKFKINQLNGCWEWFASLNENGYGQLSIGNGKIILAHRFSYEHYIGELNGMFVCHRCDNPKCVNPFHLFKGTNEDNMKDAKSKGRLQKISHPSVNHYDNHGCRCDECKKLKRISRKYGYAYANSFNVTPQPEQPVSTTS